MKRLLAPFLLALELLTSWNWDTDGSERYKTMIGEEGQVFRYETVTGDLYQMIRLPVKGEFVTQWVHVPDVHYFDELKRRFHHGM